MFSKGSNELALVALERFWVGEGFYPEGRDSSKMGESTTFCLSNRFCKNHCPSPRKYLVIVEQPSLKTNIPLLLNMSIAQKRVG